MAQVKTESPKKRPAAKAKAKPKKAAPAKRAREMDEDVQEELQTPVQVQSVEEEAHEKGERDFDRDEEKELAEERELKSRPQAAAVEQDFDDEDDEDHDEDDRDEGPRSHPGRNNPSNESPADEYALQVCFDKRENLFVGTVLEFPDIRITGDDRYDVTEDLVIRLEDVLDEMQARGQRPPEPLQSISYPEHLDVPISQNLYSKLDRLSRQERVPLDRLVTEILSAGLVRKESRQNNNKPNHQQHRQQNNPKHQNRQHNQGHNRGGGGNHNNDNRGNRRDHGGGGNRNYNKGGYGGGQNQGQGDGFLEYVRSLEKGGGSGAGRRWKKGR